MPSGSLVWFRRDLRDHDNAALAAAIADAAATGGPVYCAFVFDTTILRTLPTRSDRRVAFIHASLCQLDQALRERGGALIVRCGEAFAEIPRLAEQLDVVAVYAGRDYEPDAKRRDARVAQALQARRRSLRLVKDQALFDGDEVLTQAGRPYSVFTPYRNAWLKRLQRHGIDPAPSSHGGIADPPVDSGVPALSAIGFSPADLAVAGVQPGMAGAQACLDDFRPRLPHYHARRDFPAVDGVSRLSVHLRFGTLSIRQLVAEALSAGGEGGMCWLSQLAWRDFYFMILDHFPHVCTGAFRSQFDALVWDGSIAWLEAWQAGRTGYPLVDAAMRQLAASGTMHNRLRMVAASFLVKDLGLDWRAGERWFADTLIDYDLAANNGGWQWVASTGCDAQPWFRLFNPVTQSQKFDPDGRFIRRHLPELAAVPGRWIHAPWRMPAVEQRQCGVRIGRDYPAPIVDHAAARARTLARYGAVGRRI